VSCLKSESKRSPGGGLDGKYYAHFLISNRLAEKGLSINFLNTNQISSHPYSVTPTNIPVCPLYTHSCLPSLHTFMSVLMSPNSHSCLSRTNSSSLCRSMGRSLSRPGPLITKEPYLQTATRTATERRTGAT